MQKKDCFLVGTVLKLHGYKGEVKIFNINNEHFDFSKAKYFFVQINNILVPFFIQYFKQSKQNIIVKFEGINSEPKATQLLKCLTYVPKKWIDENKYRENENNLIGYSVIDRKLGNLGSIDHINSQSNLQQLIYVKNGKIEFCFPKHEHFIKNIDFSKKILEVEIPKEIISLN